MSDKLFGLNEIREALYQLYPNAKAITVTVDEDKILVKPNEEYKVPLVTDDGGTDE